MILLLSFVLLFWAIVLTLLTGNLLWGLLAIAPLWFGLKVYKKITTAKPLIMREPENVRRKVRK